MTISCSLKKQPKLLNSNDKICKAWSRHLAVYCFIFMLQAAACNPTLSFPSLCLPDVLCDPTDLIWR